MKTSLAWLEETESVHRTSYQIMHEEHVAVDIAVAVRNDLALKPPRPEALPHASAHQVIWVTTLVERARRRPRRGPRDTQLLWLRCA
jgi:hypothetical protein